ncbi:hypothetical protein B0T10DRAFT_523645 [Thelonectria olida]|uniref:DUF7702 domain-containing protein n=1 Tax=Thelonectria olida TaxID=1576542 RepID=A0A9P8VQ11_9HYPO|nr:hypothetical protein B0T10DRAFT_523645 [Thelonectria olida]
MIRQWQFRDGIAVTQIVLFTAFLAIGILFYFQLKNGWFSITLFSAIRLVGASCMLATLRTDSRGVWATVFVSESLGMVLLTFLLLNLLKRANGFTKVLSSWHFRVPELICWAGIGISIADFVSASRKANALSPGSLTRASVGLFVALYGWAVLLFLLTCRQWACIPPLERRGVMGFAAAIPFMSVRTCYTVIFAATGDARFSAVEGNPVIYLSMSTLMETAILTVVAWSIYSMPAQPQNAATEDSYQLVASLHESRGS